MRKYSYRFMGVIFALALCFSFSFSNLSRADACLPTCATNDSRFLTFGGQGFETFVFELLTFGIGSPAGAPTLNIRIFDGDVGGLWDNRDFGVMEFILFADPLGDTTGTLELGTWTSDGSAGLNMGTPYARQRFF